MKNIFKNDTAEKIVLVFLFFVAFVISFALTPIANDLEAKPEGKKEIYNISLYSGEKVIKTYTTESYGRNANAIIFDSKETKNKVVLNGTYVIEKMEEK